MFDHVHLWLYGSMHPAALIAPPRTPPRRATGRSGRRRQHVDLRQPSADSGPNAARSWRKFLRKPDFPV
jgi:hypothetical protein